MDFRICIFILMLSKIFSIYGKKCKLYKCSINYSKDMQRNKVNIGSNRLFCKIIESYLNCLDKNLNYCMGNLQFHTLKTILTKQQEYFNCKNIIKNKKFSHCSISFNELIKIKEPKYYCAIFGGNHIQTFYGYTFHCPFSVGTYTAISNNYLSIQITFDYLNYNNKKLTVIKKISIIINKMSNCTHRRSYTITNDAKNLLASFNDGMTYGGKRLKPSVEIKKINSTSIQISLNHILTKINLYKFNTSLSISILTSNVKNNFKILNDTVVDNYNWNHLCYHGCMMNFSINNLFKSKSNNVINNLENFQNCYNVKPINDFVSSKGKFNF